MNMMMKRVAAANNEWKSISRSRSAYRYPFSSVCQSKTRALPISLTRSHSKSMARSCCGSRSGFRYSSWCGSNS